MISFVFRFSHKNLFCFFPWDKVGRIFSILILQRIKCKIRILIFISRIRVYLFSLVIWCITHVIWIICAISILPITIRIINVHIWSIVKRYFLWREFLLLLTISFVSIISFISIGIIGRIWGLCLILRTLVRASLTILRAILVLTLTLLSRCLFSKYLISWILATLKFVAIPLNRLNIIRHIIRIKRIILVSQSIVRFCRCILIRTTCVTFERIIWIELGTINTIFCTNDSIALIRRNCIWSLSTSISR